MTRASQTLPAAPLAVLVGVVLGVFWFSGNVLANGSHADSVEAYYGAVGDYVVRVEAIPIVGDLHLVVYLTEKDDTPVGGAVVQASAVGPDQGPSMIGPVSNLPQTEYDLSLYSVTLPGALQEGVWDIALQIEAENQPESKTLAIEFPLELRDPSSFNELIIAMLAAFVLFLAWMVFSWRRQARRRRAAS